MKAFPDHAASRARGMDFRDYAAVQVMAAIMGHPGTQANGHADELFALIAKMSYEAADALEAARGKKEEANATPCEEA